MCALDHDLLSFRHRLIRIRLLDLGASRPKGWIKALAQRLDHLAEPEPVEPVEREVRCEVCGGEPQRDSLALCKCEDVVLEAYVANDGGAVQLARLYVDERDCAGGVCAIHVGEDAEGVVCAPAEAAGEECEEEDDAIYELDG